ncbi:glutamyl-tRNA(Gln) amidotransferase subunit B, putative [Plasmodium gallinaceum]|uniref:Glutamyl-tRNA(Gln) amidotransferase subunit B, putative n=1 Tax=Plasmodium gallinaceum TaxID=5849 RepID=A0A1J1GN26_PLAGA|nr:glutamyl-tRNA(Gln) amidotransferase subunit B, putative [Plasmodium gallinaceum]CRG93865.1 glutamyl-tRNA(Gln) amidotransferase subunit B, putative [Plasmodium gallinaceum]
MIIYIFLFYFNIFIHTLFILCFRINKINHKNNLFILKKKTNNNIDIKDNLETNRKCKNIEIKETVEKNIKCKIGIEIHIQLSTKYKVFCNCFNVSSLYSKKTYEKNHIDLINYLNENILKNEKIEKGKKDLLNYMLKRNIEKDTNEENNIKEGENNQITNKNKTVDIEDNNYIIKPNKYICNICIGEVGSLNILNITSVLFTYLISIIFNCRLNQYIKFDRKIYNYYDLPKGYQITQKKKPIGTNGFININKKKFLIKSIHLEEDTSKCYILENNKNLQNNLKEKYILQNYEGNKNEESCNEIMSAYSLNINSTVNNYFSQKKKEKSNLNIFDDQKENEQYVQNLDKNMYEKNFLNKNILLDYNRCGIPLAEITIEKDYMNSDDCINLLKEIKNKVCLLGVCVGNKENIRSDINISFEYNNINYNRVEIKNINSFRKIRNYIEIEKNNFINLIMENKENKNNVKKVNDIYTKSYLDNKHFILRKKEFYNYVHEGNIPEYKINKKVIKLLNFYVNYKIKIYEDEKKYQWSKQYFYVFFNDPFLYNYFNECLKFQDEKNISNFIVNILLDVLKKKKILSKNILIKPKDLCFLINYFIKNNLDNGFLKKFLFKYIDHGFEKKFLYENLKNINSEELECILKKLIDDNLKYLKIDKDKNILNEQNFKNRIIGILKKEVNENSQFSLDYKFINNFIIDYIKKSI